jgi:hypothetical protein
VLTLAAAVTLVLRDWIAEHLLKPLYIEWLLFVIYFESLPGLPLWIIFVALVALALLVTVTDLFKVRERREPSVLPLERSPLQDLAEKIELACHSSLFVWSLQRELSEVATALIMMHERVDPFEARRRFQTGAWTADTDIRKFLMMDLSQSSHPWWRRWRERVLGVSPTTRAHRRAQLEKIVAHLEAYANSGDQRATDYYRAEDPSHSR